MRRPKFTAVGCNIFAGSFTLGMRQHLDVLCHLEEGTPAHVKCCNAWLPDLPVHDRKDEWPLLDLKMRGVDVLYANPPCAVWSPCGITLTKGRDAWRTDPRTQRWFDAFAVGRQLGAKFVVIESVPRAVSPTGGRPLILDFTRQARETGYGVTWMLTDAANCGVPQRRKRFFFVAHLVDFQPACDWHPPVTPEEALAGVEPRTLYPLSDSVSKFIHLVRPGQGMREAYEEHTPKRLKVRGKVGMAGRPRFMEQRISPDVLCGTVTSDCLYHWSEPRRLAVEEYAALCGYPPDLPFPEGWGVGKRVQMMVQAVMPPVGEWVGREVKRALSKSRPLRREFHDHPRAFRVVSLYEHPGREAWLDMGEHEAALESMSLAEVLRGIGEDYES